MSSHTTLPAPPDDADQTSRRPIVMPYENTVACPACIGTGLAYWYGRRVERCMACSGTGKPE